MKNKIILQHIRELNSEVTFTISDDSDIHEVLEYIYLLLREVTFSSPTIVRGLDDLKESIIEDTVNETE